jgi:hypothetical protein
MRGSLMSVGFLVLLAGLLMASLSPGGWFNRHEESGAALNTPLGSVELKARTERTSPWPMVGYGLIAVGAVAMIAGAASRRSA